MTLVLSHNLREQGHQVETFHPFLSELQPWFPGLPLRPFPSIPNVFQKLEFQHNRRAKFEPGEADDADGFKVRDTGTGEDPFLKHVRYIANLDRFDRFFIFYEKSPWMQEILATCEKEYREKTFVLNPIATPNRDYPYWEVGEFDGRIPFVENLRRFSQNKLHFSEAVIHNGITLPKGVISRKYPKRVVLHPTSSRPGKNWPQEKFLTLATLLEEEGFEPVFILSKGEKASWPEMPFSAPDFETLSEVAAFIAESGSMIGNDSGIGHLASCLGLSTVTICRSKLTADFWRPAWTKGSVITPPAFLPNLKGLRIRDNHWKRFISPQRVLRTFLILQKSS